MAKRILITPHPSQCTDADDDMKPPLPLLQHLVVEDEFRIKEEPEFRDQVEIKIEEEDVRFDTAGAADESTEAPSDPLRSNGPVATPTVPAGRHRTHQNQQERFLDYLERHPQMMTSWCSADGKQVTRIWQSLTDELNATLTGVVELTPEQWHTTFRQWLCCVRSKERAIQQQKDGQRIGRPVGELLRLEKRLLALLPDTSQSPVDDEASRRRSDADESGEFAASSGPCVSDKHRSQRVHQQRFLEYLERHPRMMSCSKFDSKFKRIWQRLTYELNAMGFVQRTPERWRQTFSQWQYSVRHKERAVQKLSECESSRRPFGSDLEERFMRALQADKRTPVAAAAADKDESNMGNDDGESSGVSILRPSELQERQTVAVEADDNDESPRRRRQNDVDDFRPAGRHRTHPDQQKRYLDYLKRHPQMMSWKTVAGKVHRIWQHLTDELNGMGVAKRPHEWQRTFRQWLWSVRFKLRAIQKQKDGEATGRPVMKLLPLEERLMALQSGKPEPSGNDPSDAESSRRNDADESGKRSDDPIAVPSEDRLMALHAVNPEPVCVDNSDPSDAESSSRHDADESGTRSDDPPPFATLNSADQVFRKQRFFQRTRTKQQQRYLDYLERHPQMMSWTTVAGEVNRIWQHLTDELNGMGVARRPDEWQKTFRQWLYNVRSKARALQMQNDGESTGRAVVELLSQEKRLLALRPDKPELRYVACDPAGADESPPGKPVADGSGDCDKKTRLERRPAQQKRIGDVRMPTSKSSPLRRLFDERLHGFAAECERRLESDMRESLAAAAPILSDQQFGRLMACVRDALAQKIAELCERLIEDVQSSAAAAAAAAADVADNKKNEVSDEQCSDDGPTVADDRGGVADDDMNEEISTVSAVQIGCAANNDDMDKDDLPEIPPVSELPPKPIKPKKTKNLVVKKPRMECDICHELFNYKSQLAEHMLRHSGIMKFICEYCSRPFRHHSSFRLHLLAHRNQRNFVCDQCPAAYNKPAQLRDHQEIHTGEKREKCPRCPMAHRGRKEMIRHLRKMHGVALADINEVYPRKLTNWRERRRRQQAALEAPMAMASDEPTADGSSAPTGRHPTAGASCDPVI